jgi:hypothetical protein
VQDILSGVIADILKEANGEALAGVEKVEDMEQVRTMYLWDVRDKELRI